MSIFNLIADQLYVFQYNFFGKHDTDKDIVLNRINSARSLKLTLSSDGLSYSATCSKFSDRIPRF